MGLKEDRDRYFRDWQEGMELMDFKMCADSQFYLLNTLLHDTPLHKDLQSVTQRSRETYNEQQSELDFKMKRTNNLSEKQEIENEILNLEVSFWKELYTVFFQNFLKDDLISKV